MARPKNALHSTIEKWLNKNGYQAPNNEKCVAAFTDRWCNADGQLRASTKIVGVHIKESDTKRLARHLRGKGFNGVSVRASTRELQMARYNDYYTGVRVIVNNA